MALYVVNKLVANNIFKGSLITFEQASYVRQSYENQQSLAYKRVWGKQIGTDNVQLYLMFKEYAVIYKDNT